MKHGGAAKLNRRAKIALLGLALPALGLFELCGAVAFANRAPREEEWSSLRGGTSAMHKPGDLVVVAPRWAEPHARRALGDDYFPPAVVARSGSETFARAIEISILGAHSDEVAGFRELRSTRIGAFTIRELENPWVERPVFDFVDGFGPEHAVAFAEDGRPCPWTSTAKVRTGGLGGHPTFPRERFNCPEGLFFQVSRTVIADERFLPRRCIWAHPPESGRRVVKFPSVPVGQRIVGHLGMYWMIERERAGAPVSLTARVDGQEVGKVVHEDGDGWKRFEFPLGDKGAREAAAVEFEITTPDYMHRHICFQADTR